MMKQKLILYLLILFIILISFAIHFIKSNNLTFCSKEEKTKIAELLEIEYNSSFEPIRYEYSTDEYCKVPNGERCYCRMEFKIKKEDYIKSKLRYNSELFEKDCLMDFECKELINDDYYLCTIAYSKPYNEKKYNQIVKISQYNKNYSVISLILHNSRNILFCIFIWKFIKFNKKKKIILQECQ